MNARATQRCFVLVPGLSHGGWSWDRVAPLLRERGHTVVTITQTGLGERSHLLSKHIGIATFVDDVVNTLVWRDLRDVVLVGHSFGGIAITGAADCVPERIGELIYLDAAVVESGETWLDLLPRDIAAARTKMADESSNGISLPVPPLSSIDITEPADVAFLQARLTPHPFSTFTTQLTLKHPVGNGLPVDYVACVGPVYPPAVQAHNRARAKGWRIRELPTGHEAMVTHPGETAALLDSLSR
jgi:pimeloyl-ACP methyl ester carboxylesterase